MRTEGANWSPLPSGDHPLMSDALMNAIERVPANLDNTMTGFKVRDQSQAGYL